MTSRLASLMQPPRVSGSEVDRLLWGLTSYWAVARLASAAAKRVVLKVVYICLFVY